MHDVPVEFLILTGGAAARLGQDKASTLISGRSLLEYARDCVASSFPSAQTRVLGSEFAGGPAAAVVSGVVLGDSEFVGVLAVDMPFASVALAAVRQAMTNRSEINAWIPVDGDGRRQWLCAVYRRSALVSAAEARSDWTGASFGALVGSLTCVEISVEQDVSLLDIDTPADLERARAESDDDHR